MAVYSRIYSLALLFLSFQSSSNSLVKIPMDEVNWEYKGTNLKCDLKYNNPSYGKFYFRSEEKGVIYFKASVNGANKRGHSGVLLSTPAPWNIGRAPRIVTNIASVDKGTMSFSTNVEGLLVDIEAGNWLQFTIGGNSPSDKSTYLVPTIRIHNALKRFRDCQSSLPLMSYTQARDIALLFELGQITLNANQLKTLSALNSYLMVDPKVDKLLIDGYADNVGSKIGNLKISRQRAEQVASQMEKLGVDRNMIEVRAHGSRYPIASNANHQGQAKNRRVTLRLVRSDEAVLPMTPDNNDKGKV